MVKINSIEEYKSIVRRAKEQCQNVFSNIFFLPEEVLRYIKLGKAYYQNTPNGGYLLILDEDKYYRVCLHVDAKCELRIPDLDKKIVIKNVYRKGREEPYLQKIEQYMTDMGFQKEGTVVQVSGDVAEISENCKRFKRYIDKLEKKGYRCVSVEDGNYEKADELMLSGSYIKDYQIDYKTVMEKCDLLPGSYLCVLNGKEEMCAVSVSYVEGKMAFGEGVFILDEYKMQGLAHMLMYHRFEWLSAHKVKKIVAWILVNNEVSMQYHTSIGYKLVNKYIDEWVRE